MWRLIYAVPTWLMFQVFIFIPLVLIGWILIPIAAACKAYESYTGHDGVGTERVQYRFTWPFMWIWDNHEDGIANDTYTFYPDMFRKIVYWSCIRNPVNNLRRVPILSCSLSPDDIRFIGAISDGPWSIRLDYNYLKITTSGHTEYFVNMHKYDTKTPQWFFAWQGLYSNFFWQFMLGGKLRRLWIGWKIYPVDVYGIRQSDYRKGKAGFALQWKIVK